MVEESTASVRAENKAGKENEETSGIEEGVFVYELGYHLLPTLSEEELLKEIKHFRGLLEKCDGVIISEGSPKQMQLAYPMEKKQEGKNARFENSFFGWIKFDMAADKVPALQGEVEASKNVLRFLIIRTVREYSPIQHRELFKQPEEEVKTISKPEPVESKEKNKPISEEELDKTIEELVSEK